MKGVVQLGPNPFQQIKRLSFQLPQVLFENRTSLKLTYRKNYGFQFLMAKDELILN